jgi:dipeptidase E
MRLVLYSGGFSNENQALAVETGELLRDKRTPQVAFVPGCWEDAESDFRAFKRTLAPSGLKRFVCISVDHSKLSKEDEAAIFSSDAIFLGGGNTFYLLYHLRKKRLLHKLRAYVQSGGILMGLSAGSILMTPNVMTASVPSLDCDENEVGLEDLTALSLVPFEFSPHYRANKKSDQELINHSKRTKQPIYACADGEGIIVRDDSIHFVGRVTVFHRGHKYSLQ